MMKPVQSALMLTACAAIVSGAVACSQQPGTPEAERPTQETIRPAGAEDAPATVQTTCPVMGGAIDKEIYTDYQGRRVYFCCPGCIEQFEKDPERYLSKL